MDTVPGYQHLARPLRAAAVAIGNFDGVHLGHRAVLAATVEEARALGGEVVALTFDPHPVKFFSPDRAPALICSLAERLERLADLGVHTAIVQPFDRDFSQKTPAEFVADLTERVGARVVVVGHDFSFGKGRSGTFEVLASLLAARGARARQVSPVSAEGEIAASRQIRRFVQSGDVQEAARHLGRPFTLRGEIVHGQARGRTIGFPTANLAPESELLPAAGVYAGFATVRGATYPAVTNVGVAPTFGENKVTVEAHLLGASLDLYGEVMKLSFVARLRAERRFAGLDELKEQIARDCAAARDILNQTAPEAP